MMRLGFDAKRLFHNRTGLGNYSRDLLKGLMNFYSGNEYLLYNPKPKKIDRIPLKNATERLPYNFWHKKFPAIWRSKGIVKQLKKDGVQIFHGLSGELPLGIENTAIKTVVTIHDLIFERYPQYYPVFERKMHHAKFLRAARIADIVVAISEQTKLDIVRYLQIPPEKIRVIYQGCHSAFREKYTAENLEATSQKYALPPKFILNVGTIEPRKNLLTLVKALKQKNIPLVVVGGKTNYFKQVMRFIKANDMSEQVRFLDGITMHTLAKIYQLATIFCYPSHFEGFGIPIIEALYSGTPVITSTGS